MSHVMNDSTEVQPPHELHPAFYGCFDWHSSVHGHWMLVRLLKLFPDLPEAVEIRDVLEENLRAAHIRREVAYLEKPSRKSFERTYGWSWLLKLSAELLDWEDPDAARWSENLKPLVHNIVRRYLDFLPRQTYPIRRGVHANTAFGLAFALDYAEIAGEGELQQMIIERTLDYFLQDHGCPGGWEPDGDDFLSSCLIEADLMARILKGDKFGEWFHDFLPGLEAGEPDNLLSPAVVSDRSDPKIVHLDGLNLSRAWCYYRIAASLPSDDPARDIILSSARRHAASAKQITSRGERLEQEFEKLDVKQQKLEKKKSDLDRLLGPAGFGKGVVEGAITLPGGVLKLAGSGLEKPVAVATYPFREDFTKDIKKLGVGIKQTATDRPFEFTGQIVGAAAVSFGAGKVLSAVVKKGAVANATQYKISASTSKAVKVKTGVYRVETETVVKALKSGKVVGSEKITTTSNIAASSKKGAIKASVDSTSIALKSEALRLGLGDVAFKTTATGAKGKFRITPGTQEGIFKVTGRGTVYDIGKAKGNLRDLSKGSGQMKGIAKGKIEVVPRTQYDFFKMDGAVKQTGQQAGRVGPIKGTQTTFTSYGRTDFYFGRKFKPVATGDDLGITRVFSPTGVDKKFFEGLSGAYKGTKSKPTSFQALGARQATQLKQTTRLVSDQKAAASVAADFQSQAVALKTIKINQAAQAKRAAALLKVSTAIPAVTAVAGVGVSTTQVSPLRVSTKSLDRATSVSIPKFIQPSITAQRTSVIQAPKATTQPTFSTPITTPTTPFTPSPISPIPMIQFGFPKIPRVPKGRKFKRTKSQFAKQRKDYTASVGAIALGFKRTVTKKEFEKLRKKQFTGGELREQLQVKNGNSKKLGFW
ncbi:MAG: DUF2891 family protein [Candidatus Krumholzibacteriales bacterium]